MTTPAESQGQTSQRWTAMDAQDQAQRCIGSLDARRSFGGREHLSQVRLALLALAPGQRVLEVGSGTGDFARELAARVGETGSVTGIDLSAMMVAAATERAAGTGLPLTFQVGDAHHLDFPDQSFDRACAALVLIHVADPVQVLREMVRVTRPGGRVAVLEPDGGTIVFHAPDVGATRAVTDALTRTWRNPWIARELLRLFKEAGLTDTVVETVNSTSTDMAATMATARYREALAWAIQEGTLDAERGQAWWSSLERASQDGTFFYSVTSFVFAGRRV